MKLTNIIVVSVISLSLVACGGGGGDASSAPSSTTATVLPEADVAVIDVIEPDPNAIYETTAELLVSKSFRLEQAYELAVSYKNEDNRSTYLSVCTEFTEGKQGIDVKYNSCLLRTSLEGDYANTLTVANDKNRLVMAIWYVDDMENPRYEIWENDSTDKGVRTFDVN